MKAFLICYLFSVLFLAPPARSQEPKPTEAPKPAPGAGERGTVQFWQQQLQGKTKPQVKAELGTPISIREKGAVYIYKKEFFHPDLDEWRDLAIRFSEKDDFAESFTGSGGDVRDYPVSAPPADQLAPPTPTPTPSPTPGSGPADAKIKEITNKVEGSVVTMEMTEPAVAIKAEDSGTGGTGFVMERDGKKYIASNIHVLEGEAMQELRLAWHHGPRPGKVNSPRQPHKARVRSSFDEFLEEMLVLPQQKMKSINGTFLPPASNNLLLSDSRDIALVPVTTEIPPLTIAAKPPKREQAILIIGNAEATHTLQVAEAEIEQIGPDRFEISRVRKGELQPGMSGSPVVDAESGEVLGVFTYSMPSSGEKKIRFFAYRADNLTDLRAVRWSDFVRDCAIMTAFKERILNVGWASNAYAVVTKNDPVHELTPDFNDHVQIAYASFVRDLKRIFQTSDKAYRIDRWQEYQNKLETLLQAGLEEDKYLVSTPYIKRSMDTILADERSKVTEALRSEAGKVQ